MADCAHDTSGISLHLRHLSMTAGLHRGQEPCGPSLSLCLMSFSNEFLSFPSPLIRFLKTSLFPWKKDTFKVWKLICFTLMLVISRVDHTLNCAIWLVIPCWGSDLGPAQAEQMLCHQARASATLLTLNFGDSPFFLSFYFWFITLSNPCLESLSLRCYRLFS